MMQFTSTGYEPGALVRFWSDKYTHNSYETLPPAFLPSMHVRVPVSRISLATLLAKVDYQAAGLGSNQMGKESEYTFGNSPE